MGCNYNLGISGSYIYFNGICSCDHGDNFQVHLMIQVSNSHTRDPMVTINFFSFKDVKLLNL